MTKPIVPQLTQFKPRPKSILELIKEKIFRRKELPSVFIHSQKGKNNDTQNRS